jgi:hypothetical protein
VCGSGREGTLRALENLAQVSKVVSRVQEALASNIRLNRSRFGGGSEEWAEIQGPWLSHAESIRASSTR